MDTPLPGISWDAVALPSPRLFSARRSGLSIPWTWLCKEGWIPEIKVILAMIVYGLLVLTNVLIYSYHEYHDDRHGSQKSMATEWGRKITSHLLRLLFLSILSLILAAFLFIENRNLFPVYLILLGMLAILGGILAFPRILGRKDRYGILADAAFLVPGLLAWLG